MRGREAGAASTSELGTGAVRHAQVLLVGTVTGHETRARRGERARRGSGVTAGELDVPAGLEQPSRSRSPDRTRPAEDERARHGSGHLDDHAFPRDRRL